MGYGSRKSEYGSSSGRCSISLRHFYNSRNKEHVKQPRALRPGTRQRSHREDCVTDVQPESLHQRIGFIFGSSQEVERIEAYHRDEPLETYRAPLFGKRGLFVVAD